jgi:hypothetical protein
MLPSLIFIYIHVLSPTSLTSNLAKDFDAPSVDSESILISPANPSGVFSR